MTVGELHVGREVVLPDPLEHGPGCTIGDRAVVGPGCVLGARVVIGANATVLAQSAVEASEPGLRIEDDVSIGAGAVVSGATVIGTCARIEPGAVVTQDVPPHAIVAGNPSEVVGYVTGPGVDHSRDFGGHVEATADFGATPLVGGASLIRFPEVIDIRGSLTFGEANDLVPFDIKRYFFIYDVPSLSIRGEHAHTTLHEMLFCASGSLDVSITDGVDRCDVQLTSPNIGLYLPPLVWSNQHHFVSATVLLVLCSEPYDASSYVRDYDEFLSLVSEDG
jgi:UDP-2-acetamido-3-amino-2,3-dideoxy-glucuronate N-acetyltransferase